MPGLRFVLSALVALLWLSTQGYALTCQVGYFLKLNGDVNFDISNVTIPAFEGEQVAISGKIRPSFPGETIFTNWTSLDCSKLELDNGNGKRPNTFVCLEAWVCHANVEILSKSCVSLSEVPKELGNKVKRNGCFNLDDLPELKDWRVSACTCDRSNCNKKWREASGFCSGATRVRNVVEFALFAFAVFCALLTLY